MPTLGTLLATEQPVEYTCDPRQGITTTRSFKGGRAQIDSLANQFQSLGYSISVKDSESGTYATLRATISADDTGRGAGGAQVTDRWELVPNRVQKDLLESDNAMVRSLNDENIENINYYLQNPAHLGTAGTLTSKFTNTGNRANAVKAYQLMRAGVKGVYVSQPVLRHTWSIPNNVNPGYAFTNVGKILTTPTLTSTEGVPPNFIVPLGDLPTVFTNPTRTDSVPLVYGWLKFMPSLSVAAFNRQELVGEWEFGLWATDLYGAAV